MNDRLEILLAGFGGQGVVSMGIVLGRAATLDGYAACQTQSYGTESRGGSCKANVVLECGDTIGSPVIEDPDYFLAFSQAAYNTYADSVLRGVTFYDPALVQHVKNTEGAIAVPATMLAKEHLGKTLAANAVMLGAITRVIEERAIGGFALNPETVRQSLAHVFSPKFKEVNLAAFKIGYEHMTESAR
ncbi:MAG: 2-oxoacid:acceptor oxidoreductase family protein [Chloroflexi bacterium]|nr:2-oxoacid:acceptor oxidoreductase family protein [Chloroflexota bacterium]